MSECPVCKKAGLKSRPQVVEEFEMDGPLIRVDDEVGHHFHDRTRAVVVYYCTNGHEWTESTVSGCRHCETLDSTIVALVEDNGR